MAKLPVNFDANSVTPAVALEVIPADSYKAHITGSEMKPTKANDGSYCALELTILEGEYAGRKLYDNLNLVNANATASEIAYRTLSAICHAVGVFQVDDTQALHAKPLMIKVGLQAAGKGGDGNMYEARNTVRGYSPIEGANAAGANSAPPAWTQPEAAALAPVSAPPPAAPSVAAPVVSGLAAAVLDGWIKHPDSAGWHYKGSEVKKMKMLLLCIQFQLALALRLGMQMLRLLPLRHLVCHKHLRQRLKRHHLGLSN